MIAKDRDAHSLRSSKSAAPSQVKEPKPPAQARLHDQSADESWTMKM
jgi:hypothetical protein